jgi:hypothetical protein
MSSSPSVRTVSLNDVVVGSKPTHIVIYQESTDTTVNTVNAISPSDTTLLQELKETRSRLEELIKRVAILEGQNKALESVPSPFFHSQISGPVGLEVRRLDGPPVPVETVFETLVKSVRATPALVPDVTPSQPSPIELDEKIVPEEEVVEEEVEEEVGEEEVEEEEVEEEEVEEEVEEEEAMELTEFEYKGATYYRDAENQVYQKDDDGDLDDDPIGIWNESKQKVLKYPKK